MAVLPLFVATMDDLKSALRLTGAKQPDALAMINSAVQKSRSYIINQLGATRLGELVAIPYNENTLTEDGALRLRANALEIALVKLELLRSLPVIFMDSAGAKREVWNEEGLARKEEAARKDEIARLQAEIGEILSELATPVTDPVAAGGIRAETFGPETTPPAPGDSVFGGTVSYMGNVVQRLF